MRSCHTIKNVEIPKLIVLSGAKLVMALGILNQTNQFFPKAETEEGFLTILSQCSYRKKHTSLASTRDS